MRRSISYGRGSIDYEKKMCVRGHFCMFGSYESTFYNWIAAFYGMKISRSTKKLLSFEGRPSDKFSIEIHRRWNLAKIWCFCNSIVTDSEWSIACWILFGSLRIHAVLKFFWELQIWEWLTWYMLKILQNIKLFTWYSINNIDYKQGSKDIEADEDLK